MECAILNNVLRALVPISTVHLWFNELQHADTLPLTHERLTFAVSSRITCAVMGSATIATTIMCTDATSTRLAVPTPMFLSLF